MGSLSDRPRRGDGVVAVLGHEPPHLVTAQAIRWRGRRCAPWKPESLCPEITLIDEALPFPAAIGPSYSFLNPWVDLPRLFQYEEACCPRFCDRWTGVPL